MTIRKPRILVVGEMSELATGYATYAKQLLTRMHSTGKYIIAELAAYYHHSNDGWQRSLNIPWGLYGNSPYENNKEEQSVQDADPANQFGKWRFEQVCLHFRPDFVFDFRDPWMIDFEANSPFRNFFKLCWMPAVDAKSQEPSWIITYAQADIIFGYTDWALEILTEQSGGMIKTGGNTSPAADFNHYHPPEDRKAHKKEFGLDPDSFIIGTVMRNQKRKLFDDLFMSFRDILDKLPRKIADKTFLYCHTSWPDMGWNIPRLLAEYKIGNKVLFTYLCRESGAVYPAFFQGAKTISPHTGRATANMPNTQVGVDASVLGRIMQCFDVYVQYANMEGLGMPQIEAAACGAPLFSVDYSGMAEAVKKTGGFPIPVQRFIRESETHRYQAYPDNAAFVKLMVDYILKPNMYHQTKQAETLKNLKANYSWDKTAKVWMDYVDSIELPDIEQTWESPGRIFGANMNPPRHISNDQAVCWAIEHILGLPHKLNSPWSAQLVQDLDYGARVQHGNLNVSDLSFLGMRGSWTDYNVEHMYQELYNERERINRFEKLRTGQLQEPTPYYIEHYKKGELE